MVKTKSVIGKKRNASSNIQSKPAKALKKTTQPQRKDQNDLFDNLDEEMDEEEVEKFVKQINGEEEEEEDEDEQIEYQVSEEEEEYEPNEFDNIDYDDEPVKEEVKEEEEEVEEEQEEAKPTAEKQNTFRDLYMTKVTQAFGTDLDTIRQEPNFNGTRLNILIDSLEAGIDIFSNIEQEIILADEQK